MSNRLRTCPKCRSLGVVVSDTGCVCVYCAFSLEGIPGCKDRFIKLDRIFIQEFSSQQIQYSEQSLEDLFPKDIA